MKSERYLNQALKQLAEWAEAYVQNETCIPEAPDSALSDAEKGALMLIEMARNINV